MKILSVIVSGSSMLPTFAPGEVVHVNVSQLGVGVGVGDVALYRKYRTHLTLHRVIEIVEEGDELRYITKGDGNPTNDEYSVVGSELLGVVETSSGRGER